ncbi:MAG: DUF2250 domain-containing protein [candidate division Zixibacteria bacterium]|nr:DUF2250 domain-containing protein [candidate division Zixibacteria bacterium]
MKLKDDYLLARCCRPAQGERIIGYCSHDGPIKVHRAGCAALSKVEPDRIVTLEWNEIVAAEEFRPGDDFNLLDEIDFRILDHHAKLGVDYSLAVAGALRLDATAVFERHDRLRHLGLLVRVEPTMIQYRRNIVAGKWIKHRNHTYYELTPKGKAYLNHHLLRGQ